MINYRGPPKTCLDNQLEVKIAMRHLSSSPRPTSESNDGCWQRLQTNATTEIFRPKHFCLVWFRGGARGGGPVASFLFGLLQNVFLKKFDEQNSEDKKLLFEKYFWKTIFEKMSFDSNIFLGFLKKFFDSQMFFEFLKRVFFKNTFSTPKTKKSPI